MEETKWLTKGKIILIVIILLVIGGVVAFIFIHKNNLKKDYINFENQLEYAAPNYLLKEKIVLKENEWREIDIKDILKQKLVINKRAEDCKGYVIAEGLENIGDEEEISDEPEDVNTQIEQPTEEQKTEEVKEEVKASTNITYNAYITCKDIYKTKGYGTKPTDGSKNDDETQTENDTEKPKIELFGDKEITLTVGDTYNELGAMAMDNVDGDITNKIKISGKVDTKVAGTYTIKYSVSDSSKNKASISRTVIIKEKIVQEPEIPVVPEPVVPDQNKDNNDNNTPNSNPNNNPGNNVMETPTEPIRDITEPMIIFNDNSLYQTICAGNSVNTAINGAYGYIARDNVDGNITGRVKITGDTGIINEPGIYNLYYSVSDNAGNTGYATKQFTVKSCSSTIPNTNKVISVSSIRCTSMNVTVGTQKSLLVSIYPEDATNKQVTYKSSNEGVATITSAGMVKGISQGTSTITVISSNGKKGTCKVTVR